MDSMKQNLSFIHSFIVHPYHYIYNTGLDQLILTWLIFLFYINDLPKIITKNNSIVLFADDTSLLITDSNKLDFNTNINQSLHNIISWFNSNLLVLNFNKTHYVEFRTKNYYEVKTKVTYDHINISDSTETKFL